MNSTKEIELYDVIRIKAVVYADYQVFEGDTLIEEKNAEPIQVSDLKGYIIEEQLNHEILPTGGDRVYNVCTYLNDNLNEVVKQYLEAKYAK